MKRMIEQVKPAVWNRSYSNPGSQGTLIRSTSRWPLPSPMPESFDGLYFGTTIHYPPVHVHRNDSCYVPDGCDISCAYLDRMEEWDRKNIGPSLRLSRAGTRSTAGSLTYLSKHAKMIS